MNLAYVGLDRQIHLTDESGRPLAQLTAPMPRPGGAWSMLKGPADAWSWPTWSPDGQWLAAFAVETGDDKVGPSRVVTLSVDGIREEEWAELPSSAPIYVQWHPSGAALTVLMQQGSELVLGVLRRDRLGSVRPVEHGVPLFFNWTPGGERLLLHAGTPGGAGRLVLRDPLGDAPDVLFERDPGSFCAPVFVGELAVYACTRASERGSEVVVSRPDGTQAVTHLSHRGLLALVAPRGGSRLVAISHAPRGEGSPYAGIDLLDPDTGAIRNLTDSPCLAFFWAPDGSFLVYARVDADANCLSWFRQPVDGGEAVALGTFWPTRDLLFYLHFFDQYSSSHSLISADGRYIAFAGYPAGGGQADLSSPPRVWVKALFDDSPPREVARGSFAVFSPVG